MMTSRAALPNDLALEINEGAGMIIASPTTV
jgi:hypothetical protein